ncbi:MAG: hypothetical protein WAZ12_02065 [Candidatus Absconditicoccaceae bacterium]
MMRKIRVSSIYLIILLCGIYNLNISLGNDVYKDANTGFIEKKIPFPTLVSEKTKLISNIDTRFCNDGLEEDKLTDNLSIVTKPGEKKEICVIHFNRNSEDIYLWGGFSSNELEPNGNTNCSSNYERNNPFSKFIKPFKENFITVPAKGYIIRKTTIKFPVGINGIQKGCFVYGPDEGTLKEGENLLFVVRKINEINILISKEPYTKAEKIKQYLDKNKNNILYILFMLVFFILIIEIKKLKKKKKNI